MGSGNHQCKCGEAMELTSVDLGLRMHCASCSTETTETSHYDLSKGEVPPDLSTYRAGAKRRISAGETLEVDVQLSAGLSSSPTSEMRAVMIGRTTEVTPPQHTGPVANTPPGEEQPELPPGTEFGTFRVLSTLGKGGMGIVYKAHDTSLDRHVALKVLPLMRPEPFRLRKLESAKLSSPPRFTS